VGSSPTRLTKCSTQGILMESLCVCTFTLDGKHENSL